MIRDFHAEETYAKAVFVAVSAMFDAASFRDTPSQSGVPPMSIKMGLLLDHELNEVVDVAALVLMFLAEFKALAKGHKTIVWRAVPHWVLAPDAAGDKLYLIAMVEVFE
jgi:hypothetical protein